MNPRPPFIPPSLSLSLSLFFFLLQAFLVHALCIPSPGRRMQSVRLARTRVCTSVSLRINRIRGIVRAVLAGCQTFTLRRISPRREFPSSTASTLFPTCHCIYIRVYTVTVCMCVCQFFTLHRCRFRVCFHVLSRGNCYLNLSFFYFL